MNTVECSGLNPVNPPKIPPHVETPPCDEDNGCLDLPVVCPPGLIPGEPGEPCVPGEPIKDPQPCALDDECCLNGIPDDECCDGKQCKEAEGDPPSIWPWITISVIFGLVLFVICLWCITKNMKCPRVPWPTCCSIFWLLAILFIAPVYLVIPPYECEADIVGFWIGLVIICVLVGICIFGLLFWYCSYRNKTKDKELPRTGAVYERVNIQYSFEFDGTPGEPTHTTTTVIEKVPSLPVYPAIFSNGSHYSVSMSKDWEDSSVEPG